ncbi:hypothetical protein PGB90_001073 [Kerria lacca]
MSTVRKRISIHDYPEHLNPFSESHLTMQDRHKILADKLRKNSTWSSKISKRLSRSVSWFEKSWLPTEDLSKKHNHESRISAKIQDTNTVYSNSHQINELSRTESCLNVKNDETTANILKRTEIITSQNENIVLDDTSSSNSTVEIKKKKKRPAPRPPGNKLDDNCTTEAKNFEPINDTTDVEQEKQYNRVIKNIERIDEQNINEESITSREEVTETCTLNSSEQSVEVTDTSVTTISEQDLKNLEINDQYKEEEEEEEEDDDVVQDEKSADVCQKTLNDSSLEKDKNITISNPLLDVNCNNVSASEESNYDEKSDLVKEIRCNGKAIMV